MLCDKEELNLLNKRFYNAICREKFNRVKPYSHTPTNVPSAIRFYFAENEKKIFVVHSNLLFDKIIQKFWTIAKNTDGKNYEPQRLLELCYEDEFIQGIISPYPWKNSFESFYEVLAEEAFFYFDDREKQYYINIFREIKNGEFIGGLLHSLTRHFKYFNKFISTPNGEWEMDFGSLMTYIISCSINGDFVKKEESKSIIHDYKITYNLPYYDKFLYVTLYWDNFKELFIFTSASIRNK